MAETRKKLIIENARLMFCNFAGREGRFNKEGDRNFNVALDYDVAMELIEEGWNVKWLNSDHDDREPQAILNIAVNYNGPRPPRIVMITSRGKNPLNEETVEMLDYADIEMADLIVNPYHWEVSGNSGVKAYAESVFVTIRENELDLKYADMDEVG